MRSAGASVLESWALDDAAMYHEQVFSDLSLEQLAALIYSHMEVAAQSEGAKACDGQAKALRKSVKVLRKVQKASAR